MDVVLALAIAALAEPFVLSALKEFGVSVPINKPMIAAGLILLGKPFSEFILNGVTFARYVLGLQPRDKNGRSLSVTAKLRRATGKCLFLGLTGANPLRPARYDVKSGVVWHSPIAPAAAAPLPEWRVTFRGGSLKGKSSRLGAIPAFKSRKEVRFGRDKAWADVVLGETDRAVSGQHCVLFESDGALYLRDGNGQGKPSTQGTSLDKKRLGPGQTREVATATSFQIADIRIDIIR